MTGRRPAGFPVATDHRHAPPVPRQRDRGERRRRQTHPAAVKRFADLRRKWPVARHGLRGGGNSHRTPGAIIGDCRHAGLVDADPRNNTGERIEAAQPIEKSRFGDDDPTGAITDSRRKTVGQQVGGRATTRRGGIGSSDQRIGRLGHGGGQPIVIIDQDMQQGTLAVSPLETLKESSSAVLHGMMIIVSMACATTPK